MGRRFVIAVDLDNTLCKNDMRGAALDAAFGAGTFHGAPSEELRDEIVRIMRDEFPVVSDEETPWTTLVRLLQDFGAEVHFITARLEELRGQTRTWLMTARLKGALHMRQYVGGETNAEYKCRILRTIGAEYLIDDDVRVLRAAMDAGFKVVQA